MKMSFRYDLNKLLKEANKKGKLPGYIPWNIVKKVVLLRDDHRCQGCRSKRKKLEVHHLFHRPYYLRDLTSLCHDCHMQEHGAPVGEPTLGRIKPIHSRAKKKFA